MAVGDKVECQWDKAAGGNGDYYVATVQAVHADGRIDARFDEDGIEAAGTLHYRTVRGRGKKRRRLS